VLEVVPWYAAPPDWTVSRVQAHPDSRRVTRCGPGRGRGHGARHCPNPDDARMVDACTTAPLRNHPRGELKRPRVHTVSGGTTRPLVCPGRTNHAYQASTAWPPVLGTVVSVLEKTTHPQGGLGFSCSGSLWRTVGHPRTARVHEGRSPSHRPGQGVRNHLSAAGFLGAEGTTAGVPPQPQPIAPLSASCAESNAA
jgi:hypothetical protein